jgi:agmatine deiminase
MRTRRSSRESLKKNNLISYRMPAEWARHESTWLTWPTNRVTWPGRMLAETENIYVQMIRALLSGERVNLIVPDEKSAKSVSSRVGARGTALSRLVFHRAKTVDTWIRDYGPIFVKARHPERAKRVEGSAVSLDSSTSPRLRRGFARNDERAFIKFIFNAWGGKYADLAQDNAVVNRLPALSLYRRFDVPVVLEGGSIDMDGQGTCLTTEQCLLNPNRNPTLSRGDLELILRGVLGAERVIWLKDGIEADDTDGHVDDITRFVAPATVVTAVEADAEDRINHRALSENLSILRASRDAAGRRLKIIELPMPRTRRKGKARHRPHAPAGQLRQFLHRKCRRSSSGLQPPQRSRSGPDPAQSFSDP